MIGTSDQSCWLAEACKILLLLLYLNAIRLDVWRTSSILSLIVQHTIILESSM